MPLEILAPAGGEESLIAAMACGADAVYLGGAVLNARRGAKNFDDERLAWAVSYCRARGVKAYLTVNTIVLERERALLPEILRGACELGIDGVIAADLAVAEMARRACPDLPLFASTQMAVTGPEGAGALREMGFSRVVLARELTLEEIRAIRAACDIELEVFVHGALCVSVSGQCYLSSVIGGRSGNRGLCAQPCRLPFTYKWLENALSLKDLSLINRLGELEAAGVCSIKIEGRMKRPEYVAGAVAACRKAIEGQHYDLEELAGLFSRSGFTQGYLDGKRDIGMFGSRRKEDVDAASPELLSKYAALYKKERPRVPADFKLELRPEQPARLSVCDADGNAAEAAGEIPAPAINAPTDSEMASAALSKTGGTIFLAGEISCDIASGIRLSASELNALRRDALERLMAKRAAPRPIPFYDAEANRLPEPSPRGNLYAHPELRLRLERAEQLSGLEDSGATMISLPAAQLLKLDDDNITRYDGILAAELPKYEFGGALTDSLAYLREKGITRAVAGSLGAIRAALEADLDCHGDFSLNIANTTALEQYQALGLASATLSFELMLAQANNLGGNLPRGVIAYGYLPLAHLRACPVRAGGDCPGPQACEFPALRDRMGKRFFLGCDGQTAVMHNYLPLWMGDKRERFRGLNFLTLYFTKESPLQIAEILRLYKQGETFPGEYTRGLYYRGVK